MTSSPANPVLFTIALVADSHVNPREDESNSPWITNKLANARTRFVVDEINRLAPAFVVHLGDIVHPVPAVPSYAVAAERFHELFAALRCPLHLVPGNHDVGDKPSAWMPAATIAEPFLALYRRHFGKDYFSFDHQGCHFVVINCQLLNSGLADEAAHRAWLEQDLAANAGKRIFLFTHYPPFILEPSEPAHYDNIEEPGRAWLLELIARHRVEAVFAGHVHNYFYNRLGETDSFVLPSIAFVRHDYSEFFRIGPAEEDGRNDTAKLGYFIVEVCERGSAVHAVRTHGRARATDDDSGQPPARLPRPVGNAAPTTPLGLDLRHPWCEVVELPYSGALDEFWRKKARNDYPLMALWEMGARKLRVPLGDLADPAIRERMRALTAKGQEFTVFSFGPPDAPAREALTRHRDLVRAWELILRWADAPATIDAVAALKRELRVPLHVSKLRTSADAKRDGSRFSHFINHGFHADEGETIEALLRHDAARETIDGFVFRVARQVGVWDGVEAAARVCAGIGKTPVLQLRLAADNPASGEIDDLANANRVAEAMAAAHAWPAAEMFLDTLVDLDRGYFVRTGLLDRRYNPRLAARVFRHLHLALTTTSASWADAGAAAIDGVAFRRLDGRAASATLVLPSQAGAVHRLPVSRSTPGTGRWIDLDRGEISEVGWRADHDAAVLDAPRRCVGPALFVTPN